ncbi:MAG TPA: penicillin-binding protein 2, partial [bacterium]
PGKFMITRNDLEYLKSGYKIFAMAVFVLLLGRLAQVQLWNWDKYFRESERNRIREIILDPPRGIIYDRHGEILVDNRPAYSVSVIPYEVLKYEGPVKLLADILDQPAANLKQKIKKEKISNFLPVKVKRQIDFPVLSTLEESRLDLPGVFHTIESKRFYPGGVNAPHIFGYLGEITSEELIKWKDSGYRMGDLIGKSGLELQYERFLRGEPGIKYVEVDVLGREIKDLPELSFQSPKSGQHLYLTIAAKLQRYLETVMSGRRGAAVVLDPRNGDVLAILGKPDYDPEVFSSPLTPEIWNELVNDEGHPLYNRVCQSLYPPGSTFKLVLAAAALETGRANFEQKIFCSGSYRLGNRAFDCWKQGGHGEVNFFDAIEQSCNVYFYTKGLEVGLENWSKYSRLFGFGSLTGLDLPNESAGLVPDKNYFDRKYGVRKWSRGLILNLAVGQGDLLATPLQMAYLAMILGNEGKAYKPHMLRKIVDPVTHQTAYPRIDSVRVREIAPATYQKIKQGMYLVVNGPRGTGRGSWIPKIKVCGKTGTAQNPHGESHAWFIGFAPMENPEIAFCILVENGGGGGAVAAPIARGLLSVHFEDRMMAANEKNVARKPTVSTN